MYQETWMCTGIFVSQGKNIISLEWTFICINDMKFERNVDFLCRFV